MKKIRSLCLVINIIKFKNNLWLILYKMLDKMKSVFFMLVNFKSRMVCRRKRLMFFGKF